MRAFIIAGVLILAPGGAAQRAPAPENWPCIQVFTPDLSAAALWPGPPLQAIEQDWRSDAEVAALAQRLADIALPDQEVESLIAAFAEKAQPARLELAFAAAFDLVNAERRRVIAAVRRFARSQMKLLDDMAGLITRLEAAEADQRPEAAHLKGQLDLLHQLFEERQQSQEVLCEQPRRHEARAGLIGRALASRMSGGEQARLRESRSGAAAKRVPGSVAPGWQVSPACR
jgi:hypothetical protein